MVRSLWGNFAVTWRSFCGLFDMTPGHFVVYFWGILCVSCGNGVGREWVVSGCRDCREIGEGGLRERVERK